MRCAKCGKEINGTSYYECQSTQTFYCEDCGENELIYDDDLDIYIEFDRYQEIKGADFFDNVIYTKEDGYDKKIK